ncbi:hypothetical protein [Clostridium sp. Marseille-Q7071]
MLTKILVIESIITLIATISCCIKNRKTKYFYLLIWSGILINLAMIFLVTISIVI